MKSELNLKAPCPYTGKICDSTCKFNTENYKNTLEVAKELKITYEKAVDLILKSYTLAVMSPIIQRLFPESALECNNMTKH